MASPELQVLHTVVSRLDAARIQYMLSGSTALGAYATPRMTRDLDVVVQLERADTGRLTQAFAEGSTATALPSIAPLLRVEC